MNIKLYMDKKYIYTHKKVYYEISQVSVLLELKRYSLIKDIKDLCRQYLEKRELSKIDINNILPRWIMLQFGNPDRTHYVDPILPYDGSDNTQLKKDIRVLAASNYDIQLSVRQVHTIVKNLDLTNRFNKAIDVLQEFIKSDFYKSYKDNITIYTRTDRDYNYYSMKFPKNISNIFSEYELLEFKLHKTLVKKLMSQYLESIESIKNITDESFTTYLLCIILRYNSLESYNQQLAVLPEFYNFLNKKCGLDFELFASSINSSFNNYCSLFYDIESYFGSKGSFNLLDIQKGIYSANPPFDEEIMKNMAIKLTNSLSTSKHELSVIITIPVWDESPATTSASSLYGDYEVLKILKNSGYIRYIEKIDKKRAKFFDYYNNRYINPCSIYIILIQNKEGVKKHSSLKDIQRDILKFF